MNMKRLRAVNMMNERMTEKEVKSGNSGSNGGIEKYH